MIKDFLKVHGYTCTIWYYIELIYKLKDKENTWYIKSWQSLSVILIMNIRLQSVVVFTKPYVIITVTSMKIISPTIKHFLSISTYFVLPWVVSEIICILQMCVSSHENEGFSSSLRCSEILSGLKAIRYFMYHDIPTRYTRHVLGRTKAIVRGIFLTNFTFLPQQV